MSQDVTDDAKAPLIRYLRLYGYFLRFSFSRALEFRVDFFFRVIMDGVFYLTHLAFFSVLFQHTGTLGGWTLDQVFVFAAGYFFIDALNMTLFSNNSWWLPTFINNGDLDYYLVRPVSSLFFLSCRDFAANSFLNLLLAGAILTWSLVRYPEPLGTLNIALFVLLLFAGLFLHYVLHMLFIIPVFWTHSAEGIHDLYFGLETLANRPHAIYTGWTRRLLTTVIPFALIASYPTHLLFEGATPALLLHILGVNAVAFGVMLWLWRAGLRAYASASS
ncbi:MAG: ABC transporter permease [Planctomycetota bacterium]